MFLHALQLDAAHLGVTYDDLLWCVACLHSEDPGAWLIDAPPGLTLESLFRVSDWLGVDAVLKVGEA